MAAVFSIFIFLIILGFGFFLFVGGVIFLIFYKKSKNTQAPRKLILFASIVFLMLGSILALIPISFFGAIIAMNVMPPAEFVETDIVIEENGYQDKRFTAAGTIYVRLKSLSTTNTDLVPIFSYKTKGFLNGSQCGNYYLVENSLNYTLITNLEGDHLFCPIDEFEEITEYYLNQASNEWHYRYYDDDTNEIKCDYLGDYLSNYFDTLTRTVLEASGHMVISETQMINLQYYDFFASNENIIILLNQRPIANYNDLFYLFLTSDYDSREKKYDFSVFLFPSEIQSLLYAELSN